MSCYTISVSASFDAAHNLSGDLGKCNNLHGHHWNVRAEAIGTSLENGITRDENGIPLNLSKLKKELRRVCEAYDHQYLNYFFEQPTAENLAMHIFEALKIGGWKPSAVIVEESPGCEVRYEA